MESPSENQLTQRSGAAAVKLMKLTLLFRVDLGGWDVGTAGA